jgi:hypothetical protein
LTLNRSELVKALGVALLVFLLAASSSAGSNKSASGSSSSSTGVSARAAGRRQGGRHHRTANWRRRGQQKIDSERTREIQAALIRENYLKGDMTGKWDERTKAAMTRFQKDHGWQTKMLPDSRALIQLGLGPSTDHLLNPESAMTTRPSAGGGPEREMHATPASLPR